MAFGRPLEIESKNVTSKISQFYQVDNELLNDKFDLVNLGILLFKDFQQNFSSKLLIILVFCSLIYTLMPLAILLAYEPYNCKANWNIFYLNLLPVFISKNLQSLMIYFSIGLF